MEKITRPNHLAIIMDGNGRWANKRNLPRFAGHKAGIKTVRMVIYECLKNDIKILTLYAFSTENWKRSKVEITSLMNLFQETIRKEKHELVKNNIKINFLGDMETLPESLKRSMNELEEATYHNHKLTLNIAINYGARTEICQAFNNILDDIHSGKISHSAMSESLINDYLYTRGNPDPDLLIRTGGEKRISNFLLWQIAYSELWFTKTYWPDFNKYNLQKALNDFEKRVRKFGGEV